MKILRRVIVSFLLASLLFTAACSSQPQSRYAQAQEDSKKKGVTAVVKESSAGSSFNKFFPKSGGGFDRIYTQEKKGFAEAKLKKNGKDVAVISVSDLKNNLAAATKFGSSTEKISGYPAVQQGTTGTAVLVGDRYQVKALSRDASFTKDDRADWLSKFDLNGLARLQ
jgi:hypothetical protein